LSTFTRAQTKNLCMVCTQNMECTQHTKYLIKFSFSLNLSWILLYNASLNLL
jgi:hypothetical protein